MEKNELIFCIAMNSRITEADKSINSTTHWYWNWQSELSRRQFVFIEAGILAVIENEMQENTFGQVK